jgi:hypothetical protein
MQQDDKRPAMPKLDHSQLLGFRNLVPVTSAESDTPLSSNLTFNKVGDETDTPS